MKDQLKVRLLNRDWTFKCPAAEQDKLREIALHLNHTMERIAAKDNNLSREEIAVMAAINLSYELQAEKAKVKKLAEIEKKIHSLRQKLAKKLMLIEQKPT